MHIVIRKGPFLNLTLASTKFSKFGQEVNVPVIECESWHEGWAKAKFLKAKEVLFVDSGTVFTDIDEFLNELKNYPHQGLIGHIIDAGRGEFFLHEQCFLIDITLLDISLLDQKQALTPGVTRSEKNIHDDYTPLWIKSDGQVTDKTWKYFGQSLIAHQLNENKIVSNWQNKMRGIKHYLRETAEADSWLTTQQDYINLAEKQFWILNNESMPVFKTNKLITPASGLCWIRNLIEPAVNEITLVDISSTQCNFALHLLATWDGNNYGQFVYDFLVKEKVLSFNLDNKTRLTKQEQIEMIKDRSIIDIVNAKFLETFDNTFPNLWQANKTKAVNIINNDLVKFLPTQDLTNTSIWASNILDYKYTLLKNDYKDLVEVDQLIKNC